MRRNSGKNAITSDRNANIRKMADTSNTYPKVLWENRRACKSRTHTQCKVFVSGDIWVCCQMIVEHSIRDQLERLFPKTRDVIRGGIHHSGRFVDHPVAVDGSRSRNRFFPANIRFHVSNQPICLCRIDKIVHLHCTRFHGNCVGHRFAQCKRAVYKEEMRSQAA